ncbi:MAG: hypothetical protein AAB262_13090 [Elusimicrobiota bacterium]
MKRLKMLGFALGVLTVLGVTQASAVPGFARKYGVSCTACHSAWPTLNEHGREFKLNGYRQEREEVAGSKETKEISGIKIPSAFPLSAIVKSRPYDKKNNGDLEFRSRALHELELFIADGGIGGDFSYYTEIEMEDEPDARTVGGNDAGAFTPIFGMLQAGWHPKEWGNVVVAYRSFFDMDPYQTLGQDGRVTLSKRLALNEGQAANHSLSAEMQTTMAYGEISREGIGSLYYAAGMTADADDSEGKGGKDANVRLAYDCMKGGMIGVFASKGTTGLVTRTVGVSRYDQSRMGVDMLVEAMGLTVRGAGVYFYDKERGSNTRYNNRGGYIEAFYPIKIEGKPTIVPTLRQDYITTNDGRNHSAYLTAQLAAYLKPNIKSLVEYSGQTSKWPRTATGKDHRWGVQFELGF